MIGYKNLSQILTLKLAHEKDGRKLNPDDLSIIHDGAIVYNHSEILWVGETNSIPNEYEESVNWRDGTGLVFTPEIVDSHTHIVFGGNRAKEYSMRLNGADYQEIGKAGGGILSTMKATNVASSEELFEHACKRIENIVSYGVGTIEIKSGYALNYNKEKELTLIIDRLKNKFSPSINIVNTFMAAHAVPKEFKTSHQYIHEVCIPLIKDLAPLNVIDFVDIFHEVNYFNEQDVRDIAHVAKQYDIKLKTHSDEFQDNKGALLACELGATSCDHLLETTEDGIKALSSSSTVATLLPGTGFFLGKKQANARGLLDSGVKVALASDYNPGSCHFDNLLLIASISAPNLKLNMAELWASITLNAAHAVGLTNQGAIVTGLAPRFTAFKVNSIDEVTYNWGQNFATSLM
jgi:imidazolonepropionase